MTMTIQEHGARAVLSEDEIDAMRIEMEKGQQLAGHFPNDDALDRARRILTGEITPEDARAEIYAKYSR